MSTMVAPVEEAYFAQSGLRRSHSSAKFSPRQPGAFHTSASASRIHDLYQHPVKIFDDSNNSTAPSSPRTVQVSTADLSCSSTPASHLSLSTENEDCDDSLLRSLDHDNDDIVFPDYNGFHTPTPEELEPPPSPRTATSDGNETSTTTSDPHTPDISDTVPAADDTAVGVQPTRHVDYLSHDWREEDIWSSWKHIVSNRDGFTNSARLENASWRTWIKAKDHLKTISPETLNWLKDCDVTWLYGPLLPGKSSNLSESDNTSKAGLSKSNSFLQSQSKKKPILKKRSMSEVMLQKSLSSSSLIKQAAAAVQAQQRELPRGIRVSARPRIERAATDYVTFPFSSRRMSKDSMSAGASTSISGAISPTSGERKHIHFNESVEQCIAVDLKGEEDDELDPDPYDVNYDSDSDDGMVMMKRTTNKRRNPIAKKRPGSHEKAGKKMLSSLPPTRLKYEGDEDESTETAMKHSYKSPVLSPSSSQETLRPSKPSSMFFVDSEDENEDEEQDDSFGFGLRSPPPGGFGSSTSSASAASSSSSTSGFRRTISSTSLNAAPAGMKRTESGMFMPNDEGEATSEGLVGFVLDTVNTAKDIAHVVWNVGWRR